MAIGDIKQVCLFMEGSRGTANSPCAVCGQDYGFGMMPNLLERGRDSGRRQGSDQPVAGSLEVTTSADFG